MRESKIRESDEIKSGSSKNRKTILWGK